MDRGLKLTSMNGRSAVALSKVLDGPYVQAALASVLAAYAGSSFVAPDSVQFITQSLVGQFLVVFLAVFSSTKDMVLAAVSAVSMMAVHSFLVTSKRDDMLIAQAKKYGKMAYKTVTDMVPGGEEVQYEEEQPMDVVEQQEDMMY